MHVVGSDFRSKWVQKELHYYTASHSSHPTNHFYVGAVEINHGGLVRALIYWKEERTLLDYTELSEDAPEGAESLAWHHRWKLDRDTVDMEQDIAGSNYLETHRQWVDWMEQCISRGRLYQVTMEDAKKLYPRCQTGGDSSP